MAQGSGASLSDLLTQAKITNRLLAAQLKANTKQNELIVLLVGTGATHAEIADVLDTTPGTVSVALNRHRKKKNQGTRTDGLTPETKSV